MSDLIDEACATPRERSRKMHSRVLSVLQKYGKQEEISVSSGLSAAVISRLKNEHLENLMLLLAYAGFKVVSVDKVCVERMTYRSISHIASEAMSRPEIAQKLIWDEE